MYPENMKRNMGITNGLFASQKVLLELIKTGMKRQDAYELVQKSAMRTWKEKIPFRQTLKENLALAKHLTNDEIDKLFGFDEIFGNVDYIFERLGLK